MQQNEGQEPGVAWVPSHHSDVEAIEPLHVSPSLILNDTFWRLVPLNAPDTEKDHQSRYGNLDDDGNDEAKVPVLHCRGRRPKMRRVLPSLSHFPHLP